jgi:hypothetical protein
MKLKPAPVNLFNEFKVIVGDMADARDRIIDLVSSPISRYDKVVHVRNLHTIEKT